jgi:hypothetical protein
VCTTGDHYRYVFVCLFGLMVFSATFNNISAISWRSVLLVDEIGGHGANHRCQISTLYYWGVGLREYLLNAQMSIQCVEYAFTVIYLLLVACNL